MNFTAEAEWDEAERPASYKTDYSLLSFRNYSEMLKWKQFYFTLHYKMIKAWNSIITPQLWFECLTVVVARFSLYWP